MAKAVFKTQRGFTVGTAALGQHGAGPGSVGQQVHDGDTVIVDPSGNLSVRFLGVDTPEVSFTLPKEAVAAADNRPDESLFVKISDPRWETFLKNPFAARYPKLVLKQGLREYIKRRSGPGAAANHADLARAATVALRAEVNRDMTDLNQDKNTFGFFLAFASEVMDGYGRFLGFLHPNQPTPPRKASYNERMLQLGWATPYFIWPNLDPYRRQTSLVEAVPKPKSVVPEGVTAAAKQPLDDARAWARQARDHDLGVWEPGKKLRLFPSELRFLARRTPPDRWVIDLSAADDKLLHPQLYYRIRHPEDRLYVPEPYVPLFVDKGWKTVAS
jgi:endonuclease YncB( thermonuclease family)